MGKMKCKKKIKFQDTLTSFTYDAYCGNVKVLYDTLGCFINLDDSLCLPDLNLCSLGNSLSKCLPNHFHNVVSVQKQI